MGEVPEDIPLADARAMLELLGYMAASYEARGSVGIPPLERLAQDPEFKGPSEAMAALIDEHGGTA